MNKKKIFIIYAIVTTVILTGIFGPQLLILLTGWYSICYLALISSDSKKYQTIIFIISIIYPILEFTLKFMLNSSIIPYSWIWLNRIEHATFSAVLTLMIFNIFLRKKIITNPVLLNITSLSILNLFGVFNEILEFGIRFFYGTYITKAGVYYEDTILDLSVNLIFSFIALLILSAYEFLRLRKTK